MEICPKIKPFNLRYQKDLDHNFESMIFQLNRILKFPISLPGKI